MTYLDILPTELRDLIAYYSCYENFRDLRVILNTTCGPQVSEMSKERVNGCLSRGQLKTRIISESPYFYGTAKMDPRDLVTDKTLLMVIRCLCCVPDLNIVKITTEANAALRKLGSKLRIVLLASESTYIAEIVRGQ